MMAPLSASGRRHLFQLLAIVFMLLLGVLMFFVGRQHTILLDNKTLEVEGKSYQAFSIVEVAVGRMERLELAARDRDKAEVLGQSHVLTVWYTDKSFEEHELKLKFRVPVGQDMVLISLPALVGGAAESVWLQPYTPPTAIAPPVAEEPVVADDLGVIPVSF